MKNYKLTLSYDGTRYRGWQKQGNTQNTIQQKLETALSRILEQPVDVNGSGRTDAGAHAKMQVASFRTASDMPPEEILKKLRAVLPEDIAALTLSAAPDRFHARLSCVGKTYLYHVYNSPVQNVFERKFVYHINEELDLDAMKSAAAVLLGTHDFSAFCSNKRMKKSAVRRVDEIRIECAGPSIEFFVSGNGFLYNMVRIIIGTLIDVGAHRLTSADVAAVLDSRCRENAGHTAPACGLFLYEVYY